MDTHITEKNASHLLNLTLEETRNLIRKGLLPSVKINNTIYVDNNDVQAIREAIDNEESILTPTERVAILSLRVKRLEDKLNKLYKIMDAGPALTLSVLSDKDMYKLYREASTTLSKDSWSEEEAFKWATIILSLEYTQLGRIVQLSGNKHPWKIFADLGRVIKEYWIRNEFADIAVKGKEVAYLLDKGLKNLKREALFFEQNQLKEPHLLVLKYFTMPKSEQIRFFVNLISKRD